MPPPFNPVVQPGDRARIVAAHGEMFNSKGTIYALHSQLLKVAGMANSQKLRDAARVWLDHSDMIVSTSFDIDHFNAQIKDRVARGLNQFIPGMQQTLSEVQGRHDIAQDAIERAEVDLEEEYVKVLPPQAADRARERLREVFEKVIRGPDRPKKLKKPKVKDPGIPDFQVAVSVAPEFGKPPQGPGKMTLGTKKGPPGSGPPDVAIEFVVDVRLGGPPGPPGHRLTVN